MSGSTPPPQEPQRPDQGREGWENPAEPGGPQPSPPPYGGYGYPPPPSSGGGSWDYGAYGSPVEPPGAQRFTAGGSISWAWTSYWRNLGPLLLITVVVLAIQFAFGILNRNVNSLVGNAVLSVAGFVVSLILALGVIRAALAVCDGRAPRIDDLFDTRDLGPYALVAVVVGVITAVGFVLCLLPGIVAVFFLLFAPYVVADRASTDVGTALRRSVELVRSAPGEVVLLLLGLLGINLVGLLLCGVGLLFTYGISALAVAHAWRTLSGRPVAVA